MPHCQLRVLGLHRAHLRTSHLMEITGLCTALQGSLTGLAISASTFAFGDQDELVFFQALAKLTRLRVLALSPWREWVGKNISLGLVPMQGHKGLKMLVPEKSASDAYLVAHAVSSACVPGVRFPRVDGRRFKGTRTETEGERGSESESE